MQILAHDYYRDGSESPDAEGCCLLCDLAEDGCLCLECGCRKCCWYNEGDWGESGYCEIPIVKKYLRKKYLLKMVDLWHETERAYLGRIEKFDGMTTERMWIPKSVIDEDKKIKVWFLEKKHLLNVDSLLVGYLNELKWGG